MGFGSRFGALFRSRELDRDLDEELRAHIEMRTQDNIRSGMSPGEARLDALRRFGNPTIVKEETRAFDTLVSLEALWQDLRYGARGLARNRMLVLVASVSLGLGIGANGAILSCFNALVLDRVSATDPDGLYAIQFGNGNQVSYPNYLDLQASGVLPGLAGYNATELNWRDGNNVDTVYAQVVTGNFFDVLRATAAQGRTFTAEEARVGQSGRLGVISYWFWKERLGGQNILGQMLNLNGQAYTIMGILPENYASVMGHGIVPEVYVPVSRELSPSLDKRDAIYLELIGRLPDAMAPLQARAALQTVAQSLEKLYPRENGSFGSVERFVPMSPTAQLKQLRINPLVLFFALLFFVATMVFVIACANIATVLLARSVNRQREIAVRLSLGATRTRIVQQLLTETLLLAALASVAGLLITVWIMNLVRSFRPGGLPPELRVMHLHLAFDAPIFCFAVTLALIGTLASGLAPALRATRAEVLPGLNGIEARLIDRHFTLRDALVIGQVATSVLLLMVAALFLRSLVVSGRSNPGFDIDHLAIADVRPLEGRNSQTFFVQAIERIGNLPGVDSASSVSILPLSGSSSSSSGLGIVGSVQDIRHLRNSTAPGYFRTMGIPLLAGREFSYADRTDSPPVAIINQTFADRYFAGRNPIGQHLTQNVAPGVSSEGRRILEIIGVVADSKYRRMTEDPAPVLYEPTLQNPARRYQAIVIHSRISPEQLSSMVVKMVTDLDPSATAKVNPMAALFSLSMLPGRIATVLLGSIGLLAIMLASVGLYGVMAYTVTRRFPEIGIRMALGASRQRVLLMVLRDAFVLVAIGALIGTGVSLAAVRVLRSFLVAGLRSLDAATLAGVCMALIVAALAASLAPAIRATRVDPLAALRYE